MESAIGPVLFKVFMMTQMVEWKCQWICHIFRHSKLGWSVYITECERNFSPACCYKEGNGEKCALTLGEWGKRRQLFGSEPESSCEFCFLRHLMIFSNCEWNLSSFESCVWAWILQFKSFIYFKWICCDILKWELAPWHCEMENTNV